jgi:hypothetical protein
MLAWLTVNLTAGPNRRAPETANTHSAEVQEQEVVWGLDEKV